MACEQLICIVTPDYKGTERDVKDARAQLDQMLTELACVHFAAFALLPPRVDGGTATLVFELTIDPGITCAELLDRLLLHGLGALLKVYLKCLKVPDQSSQLVLTDRLRDFLRPQLRLADGGFVGARDRTVGQIIAEGSLFTKARAWLHANPPDYEERADVARRLAAWAVSSSRWRWAQTPSPRSFWRSPRLSRPVRALLLLARVPLPLPWRQVPGMALFAASLLVLAALAFTGLVALLPFIAVVDWNELIQSPLIFGSYAAWGTAASSSVAAVTVLAVGGAYFMVSTARLVTVAAFFLLVVGTVLALLAVGLTIVFEIKALVGFAGAIEVLLRTGVLALLAFGAVWLLLSLALLAALLFTPPYLGTMGVVGCVGVLLGALVFSIHLLLSRLVSYGVALNLGLYPALSQAVWYEVPALDVIVLLLFLVFTLTALLLTNRLRLPPFAVHRLAQKLDRVDPTRGPLSRAHQVHASIIACEAELASGRVNHMFSLTEVSRPVWLKSWLLRYFLRLVTLVGHTVFTEGRLANAEGIRFGHWHVIDEGKRLLFCSNFDGGFGGYLDEFINGASEGINLFWRWTFLPKRPAAAIGHPEVTLARRFPPTRLWAFGGCKYEQWFKSYARDSMLPHLYRFEAYCYTASDVQRATRFRDALFGERNLVNDDKLLRALES